MNSEEDTRNKSLRTEHLNLSIGGVPILKDISIEIPNNQITCIIGPSGCGKTTLLKTFNRLIDNVENVKIDGKVFVNGHDILTASGNDLTELRRRVGLVPQAPTPLPMSIYENVAYGPKIHHLCRRGKQMHATVLKYLNAVGLTSEVKKKIRTPATRLSLGQQQRLCLARSLAVEPDFLLADEATSSLDPISAKTIEDLFVSLSKQYTIVMVTHTLQQALRIANHVIFLYLGEVIEEGDKDQVFHNPRNELTRKYLSGAFN